MAHAGLSCLGSFSLFEVIMSATQKHTPGHSIRITDDIPGLVTIQPLNGADIVGLGDTDSSPLQYTHSAACALCCQDVRHTLYAHNRACTWACNVPARAAIAKAEGKL